MRRSTNWRSGPRRTVLNFMPPTTSRHCRTGVGPLRPAAASAGVALQRRHHRPQIRRGQLRPFGHLSRRRRARLRVVVRGLGRRRTILRTRLFWDWRWNRRAIPTCRGALPVCMRAAFVHGLCQPVSLHDGTLFGEADSLGLLARTPPATLCVDFGEFDCGVVDFTSKRHATVCDAHPARQYAGACLSAGCGFGEYLPIDAVLANGDAN